MKRRANVRPAQELLAAASLLIGAVAAAGPDTRPAPPAPWPDTLLGRLEALAVLETLNAELLSHDSATLTLQHWCGAHRLGFPANVVALRMPGDERPPAPAQRRELGVSDSEPVRYRRVQLSCGSALLSKADNWYVPSRLSANMNQQLETSDTPFGKVVQPLHFKRHTLTAELLWRPLPEGWEMLSAPDLGALAAPKARPAPALKIPADVLRHRAVLTLPDGTPVSEVIETYSSSVLGSAPQSSPN